MSKSMYLKAHQINKNLNQPIENYNYFVQNIVKENHIIKPEQIKPEQIKHEQIEHTSNPNVWGPSFWFTIHNGICKYPISASNIQKERMKGFILGIPVMLPCEICKIHANNFIDDSKKHLDLICSKRESLFKWSVDFHNSVNKRNNKKEVSYEEAKDIYKF